MDTATNTAMNLPIFIVDTFTDTQFKGNSAAVVPLTYWLDDVVMQNIAAENNLSETAFIKEVSPNTYEIRWFSPLIEIDFCGHATLAASFILFTQFDIHHQVEFITLAVGVLTVEQRNDGYIQMSFPNQCPDIIDIDDIPDPVFDGLSIKPIEVLKNRQAYFAILPSEQAVLDVNYDVEILKLLAPYDVVVTSSCNKREDVDNGTDFVSRYFWPASGGHEDPVTGSIHAGLTPYWSEKLNKKTLIAVQASARGGQLMCEVEGDRVLVSGTCVLYLKGNIFI